MKTKTTTVRQPSTATQTSSVAGVTSRDGPSASYQLSLQPNKLTLLTWQVWTEIWSPANRPEPCLLCQTCHSEPSPKNQVPPTGSNLQDCQTFSEALNSQGTIISSNGKIWGQNIPFLKVKWNFWRQNTTFSVKWQNLKAKYYFFQSNGNFWRQKYYFFRSNGKIWRQNIPFLSQMAKFEGKIFFKVKLQLLKAK